MPRETRSDMARLLPMIGLAAGAGTDTALPVLPDWRAAPLFAKHSGCNPAANPVQENRRLSSVPPTPPARDGGANDAQSEGIFVAHSSDERVP